MMMMVLRTIGNYNLERNDDDNNDDNDDDDDDNNDDDDNDDFTFNCANNFRATKRRYKIWSLREKVYRY